MCDPCVLGVIRKREPFGAINEYFAYCEFQKDMHSVHQIQNETKNRKTHSKFLSSRMDIK